MVSVDRFGLHDGGAVSSGFLAVGETVNIPIVLNTKYVFLPLLNR